MFIYHYYCKSILERMLGNGSGCSDHTKKVTTIETSDKFTQKVLTNYLYQQFTCAQWKQHTTRP